MRQQLIEDNMNLVYFIVSRYYPTYIHDQDIIQCGMVGLCRAAETWDEKRSKFSTYASKCVRNEINREFQSRKKHKGVLSLDYEVNNGEGGKTTFGDLQIGDEDVPPIDNYEFYDTLTDEEKRIFDIDTMGFSPTEIAELCGCNVNKVWRTQRIIQYKWRNFNED